SRVRCVLRLQSTRALVRRRRALGGARALRDRRGSRQSGRAGLGSPRRRPRPRARARRSGRAARSTRRSRPQDLLAPGAGPAPASDRVAPSSLLLQPVVERETALPYMFELLLSRVVQGFVESV